jgi:hypothetical protein
MRYEEHAPPAAVAAHVACLWTLTGDAPGAPFDLILPDGRPELVVHRGDRFRQRRPGGGSRLQPRQLVVGQMSHGVAIAPGRRVESIGVRFTPAGLAPLCPFPQSRLVDRIAPVADVPAPSVRRLAAAATAAPTLTAALAALDRELPRAYAESPPVDPRLLTAVDLLSRAGGTLPMAALARATGAFPRWLGRHFTASVGVSPSASPGWCASVARWPRSTPGAAAAAWRWRSSTASTIKPSSAPSPVTRRSDSSSIASPS